MVDKSNIKQTILIVDDQQTNIKVLADVLSDRYNISVATSGDEALKLVHNDLKPNMILLDIMMPGKDGFQVCEELKANAGTSYIPVIFVTAMEDQINEERGLNLGAVDYIYKPINPAIVHARIRLHLELQYHREFLMRLLERTTDDLHEAQKDALTLREFINERLL